MPICLACKRMLMQTHDWEWSKKDQYYPICKDCYDNIISKKKPVILPLSHRLRKDKE